jgi:hypothetical protein
MAADKTIRIRQRERMKCSEQPCGANHNPAVHCYICAVMYLERYQSEEREEIARFGACTVKLIPLLAFTLALLVCVAWAKLTRAILSLA